MQGPQSDGKGAGRVQDTDQGSGCTETRSFTEASPRLPSTKAAGNQTSLDLVRFIRAETGCCSTDKTSAEQNARYDLTSILTQSHRDRTQAMPSWVRDGHVFQPSQILMVNDLGSHRLLVERSSHVEVAPPSLSKMGARLPIWALFLIRSFLSHRSHM